MLGFVIILISVGLNYYLFNQSTDYYRELNAVRLDPLGLSYYPVELEQGNSTGRIRVVYFGDSRAENWPAPPDLTQFQFINRGIGAQTSAQVLQRFDQHVAPLQPQIIILQVGINDLKTLPLFPEQENSIVENCMANIRQIITRSTDLAATVVLTTIFPIGDVPLERRLFWSDDIAQAVDEVNTDIHSLAAENVIILDTFSLLADNAGVMQPEYAIDTLHINAAGYAILNESLESILTAIKADR